MSACPAEPSGHFHKQAGMSSGRQFGCHEGTQFHGAASRARVRLPPVPLAKVRTSPHALARARHEAVSSIQGSVHHGLCNKSKEASLVPKRAAPAASACWRRSGGPYGRPH